MNDSTSDWWETQRAEHASEVLGKALEYARYGLRVFPVEATGKRPLPGYGWAELATSETAAVVDDFARAIELWGEDATSVAWALGRDGYLAVDFDVAPDDYPNWAYDIVEHAAINPTKRGQHFVFRDPDPENPASNSTVKFPTQGWGDIRGRGGYIVIAGPDRLGFDVDALSAAGPFPEPGWLTPYSGGADAVTWEEAKAFARQHTAASMPNKANGLRAICDNWDESRNGGPQGRHETAVYLATLAAEEALAGYYPYETALAVIKEWWERVTPPERHGRELRGVVCWGIARALDKAEAPASVDASPPDASDEDDLLSSTFDPVDLASYLDGTHVTIAPDVLLCDDGSPLIYLDRLNGIHGDSGSGKSFIAAYMLAQLMNAGHVVMVIDTEDSPATLIERLRLMNVPDGIIRANLVFIRPDEEFTRTAMGKVIDVITARGVAHVVLDSLGEAFGMSGIDENADAQVTPFISSLIRHVMKATGAGFTLIDHVVKNGEGMQALLHASGSKRKRASITGTLWAVKVDVERAFSRERSGYADVICAKDRHGHYARGQTVAKFHVEHADGTTRFALRRYQTGDTLSAGLTRKEADLIKSWADANLPLGLTHRMAKAFLRDRNVSAGDQNLFAKRYDLYANLGGPTAAAMAAEAITDVSIHLGGVLEDDNGW